MTGKDILIGGGAILLSGLILKSVTKKKHKKRPATGIKTIPFEAEGETILTLPLDAEFVITYDKLLPWVYSAQESSAVKTVQIGDGIVRFKFVGPLVDNQPTQVYVQALDENEDLLAEHKVTVFKKA